MPVVTGGNTINSSDQLAPGVIENSDVSATAAIAASKLNLTGAIDSAEIAAETLVTASETIASNDNDTTIPTSAAVRDEVTAQFGAKKKEMWIPVQLFTGNVFPFNAVSNGMPTRTGISTGNDFWFGFRVPDDFVSIDNAEFICNNGSSGALQADFTATWGAVGETVATGTDSVTDVTSAQTTFNMISSLNFAAALDGIAAGDYVGVLVNCDDSDIQPFGAWIKYTPS